MSIRRTLLTCGAAALFAQAAYTPHARAGEAAPRPGDARPGAAAAAVEPKPLSRSVQAGLAWLAKQQLPNGAWGQGEESVEMGRSLDALKDQGNVADTCIAALSLLRAGSTPKAGPHAAQLGKALDFVIREVEASDADSLAVTRVRGTRVQMKIGPYIDTFMSSMLLAESKGKMPDAAGEARLGAALAKVLRKIERNQRSDGTWEGQAWAPVLSQAVGAKGVNRAAQAGAAVSDETLRKTEKYAQQQFDRESGTFGGDGNAGVKLYAAASSAGSMSDAMNTRAIQEKEAREELARAKDDHARQAAEAKLADHDRAKAVQGSANAALLRRLDDPGFIAGFGSNGGEEFLSYMLVSESLLATGGREWKTWDAAMTANLGRVQNPDGSWTGHHCITGRTFVTASALLVLTADRAPVPLAAQLRRG